MPANAEDVAVLRIVVREGFGMDLADMLLDAIGKAVAHLEAFPPPRQQLQIAALGGEGGRQGAADAPAGARDDDDVIREPQVHRRLRSAA